MSEEFKQKKILKAAGKFTFIAGAVFVGVTLAILLSASILKPKHPPMRGPVPMGIERRLPPPPAPDHYFGGRKAPGHFENRGHRPDFQRPHHDKETVRPDIQQDKKTKFRK